MATVEFEHRGSEEERVIEWRATSLIRAGYESSAAFELALRTDVDLHRAVDLVRRGCPPATAARVLI